MSSALPSVFQTEETSQEVDNEMIPVTYGYTRVSKIDYATRNLETQLHILQELGIREEDIFAEEITGSSMSRPTWNERLPQRRLLDLSLE